MPDNSSDTKPLPPPSLRQTLSRVVVGLMLAGAVYLLAESLGFGATRKERDVSFLLPPRTLTQLEITYLLGDNPIRSATYNVSNTKRQTDTSTLAPGEYNLRLILRGPDSATVLEETLSIHDETSFEIDLK